MDHNSTTTELVQACRCDLRQAQSILYGRFERKMNGVALRYIRDRGQAETVMVEGFYKAFTKLDQLQDDTRFEPWLRRIIVNESIGYIRKNRKYDLTIDIEPYHAIDSHLEGYQKLMKEDLLKMIRSLPDGYRVVFNMYAIDECSHQEISDQLGIPVNTSKSKLFRARNMLQEMLEKRESQVEKHLTHGK